MIKFAASAAIVAIGIIYFNKKNKKNPQEKSKKEGKQESGEKNKKGKKKRKFVRPEAAESKSNVPLGELIFIGCGSSTGTPKPACLLDPSIGCTICPRAAEGDPRYNKNYRGNPAMVVRYKLTDEKGQTSKFYNLQIDCGKSFKEHATRWYPYYDVDNIDSIILTHDHADAIFGLDEVRGFQGWKPEHSLNQRTEVWMFTSCFPVIKSVFPYLVANSAPNIRQVAKLDWKLFDSNKSFQPLSDGFEIMPLLVQHGPDYLAHGFAFGREDWIVYLSDVSEVPKETMDIITKRPISVLVVDCLFRDRNHPTHFSMPQALAFIRRVRPKVAYLTGLSDEFDYEVDNAQLKKLKETEGLHVELAHDGLWVPVYI